MRALRQNLIHAGRVGEGDKTKTPISRTEKDNITTRVRRLSTREYERDTTRDSITLLSK